MNSSHFALALVAAVAVALAVATGGAVAQEHAEGNETETYQIAIDDQTRIVSSEWDGATVTMVVEADVPRRITVTDASQEISGAIDIRRTRTTVPGGQRAEISFEVENPSDAAVTVQSGEGIVGLGSGGSSGSWFDGPATWELLFLTVPVVGYGTFWGTKRHLEKQEREQEKRQVEVVR